MYPVLDEVVGNLELNKTGSPCFPRQHGIGTLRGNEKGYGLFCSSLFQVQNTEAGDGTRSLLVRKVAMTTVFGSIVTSVMADGQAWLAQAVAQWG